MSEAWFSEVPRWLALLSMLSLFAIVVEQGRFKTAMTAIWIAAMVAAGALLAAAGVAVAVNQPSHVVRGLTILGVVFGGAFGGSFPALRRSYREAELRKTIAADL
jgi:hypothetical protein